jgi:hypothetical protein
VRGYLIRSIDLDLGEERKGNSIFDGCKFPNLSVGTGLLVLELIAREGQDFEALVAIVVVQFLQLGIGLLRVAAVTGHIDHQKDCPLVTVLHEWYLGALHSKHLEIEDGALRGPRTSPTTRATNWVCLGCLLLLLLVLGVHVGRIRTPQ